MATVVRIPVPPVLPVVVAEVKLTDRESRAIRHLLFSGIGSGAVEALGLDSLSNALANAGFTSRGDLPRFTQVAQV